MLLFGDAQGGITLADRNFRLLWRHHAFKGEVKGVAYIYDPSNHNKQFVFAVGDEFVHFNNTNTPNSAANTAVDDEEDYDPNSFRIKPAIATSPLKPSPVIPHETYYMIKIFNAADMSRPLHCFHASPGVASTAKITAFTVLPDGCQIALGFDTGTVLLFSGGYIREDGAASTSSHPSGGGASGGMRYYLPDAVLLQRERLDRRYFPVSSLHFCELRANSPTSGNAQAAAAPTTQLSSARQKQLQQQQLHQQQLYTQIRRVSFLRTPLPV
jgi:hypothetical protein